jgi:hypothetical protein
MCVCIEVAPRVPEWLVASLVRIHCWQLQQLIGSQWCRECVTGRASFVEETKQNGGEAINLKKNSPTAERYQLRPGLVILCNYEGIDPYQTAAPLMAMTALILSLNTPIRIGLEPQTFQKWVTWL